MAYVEAYHGTSDVENLLNHGISLGQDSRDPLQLGSPDYAGFKPFDQPVIFLTNSMKEARYYSEANNERGGVVMVKIPASWITVTEHGAAHGYGFERTKWYLITRQIPKEAVIAAWQYVGYGNPRAPWWSSNFEYKLKRIK